MITVVPRWNNRMFVEWRKWNRLCDKTETYNELMLAQAAMRSIESILKQEYAGHPTIVGHLIFQTDLKRIAAEERLERMRTPKKEG